MLEPLGSVDLTRVRRTAGVVASTGRRAAPTEATLAIRGNLQPLAGNALQTAIDFERMQGLYILMTRTEVRTANQHAGTLADLIQDAAGVRYEVRAVEVYGVIPSYQATCTRIAEVG